MELTSREDDLCYECLAITLGDCENMHLEGYSAIIENGDITKFIDDYID